MDPVPIWKIFALHVAPGVEGVLPENRQSWAFGERAEEEQHMQGIPHSRPTCPLGYLPFLQITTKVPVVARCVLILQRMSGGTDTI